MKEKIKEEEKKMKREEEEEEGEEREKKKERLQQARFHVQSDTGKFMDLYVPWKCSASNCIIGAKDHASIHMNVAKGDKVTGRFNGQFKTCTIYRAIRRMGVR
ncbi:40S ribosomal protein S21 [Sciurus carolinensis]|uniref:40S ribosomal protein S21 n=1 Tax=Sciurus carolinensis TaxID=30640 RepID=A0AA41MDI5_SCICA|nr:40S ribosomal protein S21 [Sciurus carolinensis]